MDFNEFQVGDVVRRQYGIGNRRGPRTRTVLEIGAGDTGTAIRMSAPVEGGDGECNVSRDNQAHYTLVERPGDTIKEEVKQMTKFNAGDIIQYDDDRSTRRVVLAVDADNYTISARLAEVDDPAAYHNRIVDAPHQHTDDRYSLVVAAPATSVTDAHKADMATLSTKLAAEARSRGWCGDYQRIVDTWNQDLNIPLEPYPTTNVRTTVAYTVHFERTDSSDGTTTIGTFAADLIDHHLEITAPEGWTLTGKTLGNWEGVAV